MEISKVKIGSGQRDKLFKKEYTDLKIKVALNWFEMMALGALSFIGSFKLLLMLKYFSLASNLFIAFAISLVVATLFCIIRKYQLKISRFDKEHIYKKISEELLDESKNTIS